MGKKTNLKKLLKTVLLGLITLALSFFVGCSQTDTSTYYLETGREENVVVYQTDFDFNEYFSNGYIRKVTESGEEFILPLTFEISGNVVDTNIVGEKSLEIKFDQQAFIFNYVVKYQVDFVVDGEVVDTQFVLNKDELDFSNTPSKAGYTFIGWEQVEGTLSENVQLNAIFAENVIVPTLSPLSAIYGDTLNLFDLPSNKFGSWQFEKDGEETVGDAGENEFEVKFVLSNGTVFATDTIKIEVAKKKLDFVLGSLEFEYDGEEKQPSYQFEGVDKEQVEVFYIPTYNGNAINAGKYGFEYIIDSKNYEGEIAGEFEITKKQVKVEIEDATMKYNEVVPNIAFSVKDKNGNDLEQKFLDNLQLSLNTPLVSPDVGEYVISIKDEEFDNFEVEVQTGKLTVNKNVYNVDVIVNETQSIYGSTLKNITLDSTVINIGKWSWEDDSIVILSPNTFTASVIFTPTDELRYETIEKEITFKVNPKEVEIVVEENEYVYDGTQKSIVYSVKGLINNDTVEVKGNVEKTNADTYETILFIEDARYTAISKATNLVINKASIADFNSVQNGLEVVTYHKERASKLSHITLPENYAWVNAEQTLEIGTNSCEVVFTPNDTANYQTETKALSLTVNKGKGTISVNVAQGGQLVYNPLNVYDFSTSIDNDEQSAKYEYKYNGEKTSGLQFAGDYEITITYLESKHYEQVSKVVNVIIAKVENVDEVPSTLNATYLDTLKNYTDALPNSAYGTWSWKDSDSAQVGNAGKQIHKAVFAPFDTVNYSAREIEVEFNVAKKSVEIPQEQSVVYNGVMQKANLESNSLYEVNQNGGVDVGEYDVILSLKDKDNYTWKDSDSTDIALSFTITKATNRWTTEPSLTKYKWTYGQESATENKGSATFGEVEIAYYKGETKLDAMPTNAGEYKVVFSVAGTDNYTGLDKEIPFTIEKASVNAPTSSSYVYDGKEKTFAQNTNEYTVENNKGTNAGSYTVKISLIDQDNYKWKDGDSNDISVEYEITQAKNEWKLQPFITSSWTYGTTYSSSTGIADFGEVEISYYKGETKLDSMPTNAGEYKVVFSVAGTDNYTGLNKEFAFTIEKASVTVPTRPASKVYTGATLKADVVENELYTITNNGGVDVGEYDVVYALKDKYNYKWKDSNSEDITYTFEITKATNTWVEPSLSKYKWTYGQESATENKGSATFGEVEIAYYKGETKLDAMPTNAGEYKVVFSVAGTDNYTGLDKEFAFAIEKASVNAPTSSSYVYDGKEKTFAQNTNEYTVENNKGTNAGSYAVKISLIDQNNYKWKDGDSNDISVEYKITQAKNEWKLQPFITSSWTYGTTYSSSTGIADFGEVEISYYKGETKLDDMPTDAGEYKVVFSVAGTDNYTGLNKEVAFTIEKASVEVPTAPASKVYTSETLKADVVENELYTITNDGGVIVGNYDVIYTLVDKDNYKWKDSNSENITYTFSITKATNTWVEPSLSKYKWTYGQESATENKGSATFGEVEIAYYKGETKLDAMPTDAGEYKVVFSVAGTDNYTGLDKEFAFTIEKASVEVPTAPASKPYTGATLKADVVENELYTITNNGGVIVGEYDVVYALVDKDNYKWKDSNSENITYTFEITKATNTWVEPSLSKPSWTYGQESAIVNETSADFGEVEITYYQGETKLDAMPTDAGSYKVVFSVAGTDNYTGLEKSIEFTIEKIVEYVPQNIFATYTGETIIADIQDTLTYTVIENNGGVEVGDYDVKLQLVDSVNYKWNTTDDAVATIKLYIETSEDNKWIVEPSLKGWIYGQTASEPHYQSRFGEVEITYYQGETKLDQKPTNAGNYKAIFIVEETENYIGLRSEVDFTIEKASVTVHTRPASKVYTGATLKADVVENELYTITNNGGVIVGEYDVIYALVDKDNYKWKDSDSEDITYTFSITKATNTWVEPSLSKQSWIYGQESATVNETSADFGEVEISYYKGETKLDAMPTDAGEYKVVFRVAGTDNYTGLDREFAFTIEKASVEVPTVPASKVYTSKELKADVVENELYTITNDGGVIVGEYDVIYTLEDEENYKWSDEKGGKDRKFTFTITKATNTWVEPTISKSSWIYGQESATVNETSADFGEVEISYYKGETKLDAMPTDAGEYKVVFSVAGTDNYTGLNKEVAFTIEKASVEVPTAPTSKTYTGATLTADVVENELYTITNNGGVIVGEYDVIYALVDKENYKWKDSDSENITYTFAITKATNTWVEPSLSKPSWTYGQESATVNETSVDFGKIEISYYKGETKLDDMPTDAGSYKVVFSVAGTDNYTGLNKEFAFTIEKASVEVPTAPASKTYTGATLTADVVENELYTITNNGGVIVGNYDVVYALVDTDNYKWANSNSENITYTFSITKATNTWVEPSLSKPSWTYGQESAIVNETGADFGEVEIAYYKGETKLDEMPTDAGSYKVVFSVAGTDNYTGLDKEIPFTIEKASVEVPTAPASKPYTGGPLKADVKEGDYVVIKNDENINVGRYEVIYGLPSDNYKWKDGREGNVTYTFLITIADNEWTSAPTIADGVYGKGLDIGEYKSKFGSDNIEVLFEGINGTEYNSDIAPTKAGTYVATFSVAGTDNYKSLTEKVTFTIEKASVTVPTTPASKPYTGATLKADVVENELYTITNNGGVIVGEYDVIYTLADEENYKWSDEKGGKDRKFIFTITKATNKWTTEPSLSKPSWIYGENSATITTGSATFGEKVEVAYYKGETKLDDMPTDAGSYKVVFSVAGTDNYTGLDKEIPFTIEKVSVTAPGAPDYKRYTGATLKANVVENELYTIINEGGVDIGEYDVIYTLKNPENYKWSDGTSGAVLVRKFLIAKILNAWVQEPYIDNESWVYGSTAGVINLGVASFGSASITYYNSKTNIAYGQMPTDVGSYYAILSIAEGSNYTGLTHGEDINNRIEFEITPFKLTITSAPTFNDNQVYENAIDVNSSAFTSALVSNPVLDINTATGTYSYTPIIGQAIGTDGKVNVNVNFVPSSANYSAPDPVVARIAVKKVAYIGSTYYGCIESAIMAANASTSTVEVWVVAGEKSAVIASNTTINSNVTLNVPHTANAMNIINSDGSVTATLYESSENANDDNNARSVINALTVVTIKSGVELTINGTLKVAGELSGGRGGVSYAGQTTGKAAKILMQANAKIVVKGTLNLFGIIIEEYNSNGSEVVVDGGNLYIPYVVRDFRGGTYMSMVYTKATAFNEWEIRNVTSLVTIKNSANVFAYANLYASSGQNSTVVCLVTTNEKESIVHFTTTGGELKFKYNIVGLSAGAKHTNDSWQDGVMTIKIYGGAITDPLELSAAGTTVSMDSVPFPFTWRMNVALYNGNYTMGYKYKLMPGAIFTVGTGATLTINTLSVYTQAAFNGVSQDGLPAPHYKTNAGDGKFIIENGGKMIVTKAVGGLIQIKSGGTLTNNGSTSVTTYEGKKNTGFLGSLFKYTTGSIKMSLSTKNI